MQFLREKSNLWDKARTCCSIGQCHLCSFNSIGVKILCLLIRLSFNFLDQKLDEANAKSFNEAIDKLSLISKILSLFLHNIHILPTSGYPGASQERFLNLFKKLQEDVLKPIITAFQNINKKVGIFLQFYSTLFRFFKSLS